MKPFDDRVKQLRRCIYKEILNEQMSTIDNELIFHEIAKHVNGNYYKKVLFKCVVESFDLNRNFIQNSISNYKLINNKKFDIFVHPYNSKMVYIEKIVHIPLKHIFTSKDDAHKRHDHPETSLENDDQYQKFWFQNMILKNQKENLIFVYKDKGNFKIFSLNELYECVLRQIKEKCRTTFAKSKQIETLYIGAFIFADVFVFPIEIQEVIL